ncbi:MAG: amidohydrolase [Cyclobacteriaceae bacterium]|nr:MAG: amidohydrolase [Cyclobacteriaceae bacterium]
MSDLSVTLVQSDLHWHQPAANLAMFEEKIWTIEKETDVIVLPEMFTTGFTMEASELAEPMGTGTFRWMQQQAEQTRAAITGSYIIKDQGKYFNRLLWVTPDGGYTIYDKRHLFRMAEEHQTYQEGTTRPVFEWKGWKILPQICYDLRFPVWSRNKVLKGKPEFDLMIYVANWPAVRITAWDVLLRARAMENSGYCVGLNRTGNDGKGINYNGHSAVIDPKGELLYFADSKEQIGEVTLSMEMLKNYRQKFPVHLDADDFTIQL